MLDTECVVVSVNYRHAPEHMYPAAIEDSIAALIWLQRNDEAKELEIDRKRVVVGGLSA